MREQWVQISVASALIVILAVGVSSAESGQAMPLTKENITGCALRMQAAIESVTPDDQKKMIGNANYSHAIIQRIIVDPIVVSGYGFEPTILEISNMIENHRMPEDLEYAAATGLIMSSVIGAMSHLVSYGLMSVSTANRLGNLVNAVKK